MQHTDHRHSPMRIRWARSPPAWGHFLSGVDLNKESVMPHPDGCHQGVGIHCVACAMNDAGRKMARSKTRPGTNGSSPLGECDRGGAA